MIALHLREMGFEKIIDGSIIFSKISPNVQSRYAGSNPVIPECKAIIILALIYSKPLRPCVLCLPRRWEPSYWGER
jgi:hypothetical protein